MITYNNVKRICATPKVPNRPPDFILPGEKYYKEVRFYMKEGICSWVNAEGEVGTKFEIDTNQKVNQHIANDRDPKELDKLSAFLNHYYIERYLLE